MTDKCTRCDGCGEIADTDEGEPWTQWANLPLQSATAVLMGIVKPIPCPKCGGAGIAVKRGEMSAKEANLILAAQHLLHVMDSDAPGDVWYEAVDRLRDATDAAAAPARAPGGGVDGGGG